MYWWGAPPRPPEPELGGPGESIGGRRVQKVPPPTRRANRKQNRRNFTYGKRPDTKRALITLAEGDSIELFDV